MIRIKLDEFQVILLKEILRHELKLLDVYKPHVGELKNAKKAIREIKKQL